MDTSHLTETEMTREILERVIRIESRTVQLGDHVGANLRSKQRIEIEPTRESVVAYIDAMDVSLSRISTEILGSIHWQNAKPGTHMVQIRLGTRREHVVVGDITMRR
jgi:hypothetical protein